MKMSEGGGERGKGLTQIVKNTFIRNKCTTTWTKKHADMAGPWVDNYAFTHERTCGYG